MKYVIYRKSDTYLIKHPKSGKQYYETEKSASTALTKMLNAGRINGSHEDYAITGSENYHNGIEKMVVVKNLMSGKDVVQSINTPLCCDPSSELYWSM